MEYQINYKNGIAHAGDTSRIKKLMARAQQGEALCIGFIGGSITQGSLSSAPQLCYAYQVYEWWCRTFPASEFTYINAGIGGTTSQFGVARVEEDLLDKRPDFVIIEFSVNDESTEHFMETYEGLVRRVYGAAWRPAVLLVHNVYYHNGANAQLMHGRIGRHYDLPAVSMQSSIYPEVVKGAIANRDITPDDLHPNDAGHGLVASVITYFLEQVRCGGQCREGDGVVVPGAGSAGDERGSAVSRGTEEQEDRRMALPIPLTENAYENSIRYRNDNSTPVRQGFVADDTPQSDITDCFKRGWTAARTGDSITFSVEGTCIAVQYRKSVKLPAPVAEVILDGDVEHAVRLDANFDETWGDKLELDTILEHGEKGMHQVEIRLVETHEKDAVPFYLVSVITS